jgi:hypothetical protein
VVPEEGLEPSRGLTPPDFESGASAIPPLRHKMILKNFESAFKSTQRLQSSAHFVIKTLYSAFLSASALKIVADPSSGGSAVSSQTGVIRICACRLNKTARSAASQFARREVSSIRPMSSLL